MKEKKTGLYLIVIAAVLALTAGWDLFTAVILFIKYHDYGNMLNYLSSGIVYTLLYATAVHLWFTLQRKGKKALTLAGTTTVSFVKHQHRIIGIRSAFIVLFIMIDLIACACFYRMYDSRFFLIISSCMSLFTILLIVLIFLRHKANAFVDCFCAMNHEKTEQDSDSLYIYEKAVNYRMIPFYVSELLLQLYLVIGFLNSHYVSFKLPPYIISFLCIGVAVIVNKLLFNKTGDYAILAGLDNNAQSTLTMLKQFYANRSYWLKPKYNVHTFVILSLYLTGGYEDAYRLTSLIAVKHRKAFTYYTAMFTLICQKQLHDEKGMRMTMAHMQQIWKGSHKHHFNMAMWERGRYFYELSEAWLCCDTKAIEAKIDQSKNMSAVMQQIAAHFQKGYE